MKSKRDDVMVQVKDMDKGYIYIASSKSIHYYDKNGELSKQPPIKIGKATDWDARIAQLNTAVPIDFSVHRLICLPKNVMSEMETMIHNRPELKSSRIDGTEFFMCGKKEAMRIAAEVLQEFARGGKWRSGDDYWMEDCILQYGRSKSARKNFREKLKSGECRFEYAAKGVVAHGHFIERNFILEKGSQIVKESTSSFPMSRPHPYYVHWKDVVEKKLDRHGQLKEDEVCSCISEATSIVCATNMNGDRWKWCGHEKITVADLLGK